MPDYSVQIPVDSVVLEGNLTIPVNSEGIVVFAHGSGSNRYSARNQMVAQTLTRSRIATLLVDLLTPDEDKLDRQTHHLRFDIGLLALRVTAAIDWLANNPAT
ncbi:MAG: alpha/beta hydrolase, partial [Anaerolineae bacterium]|nr:alpha/beta hydrolase [Anaerolineae bacterium]